MKFSNILRKYSALSGVILVLFFAAASLQAQPADNTTGDTGNTGTQNKNQASDGWRTDDYKPYITSLKDLEKLSKDYAESRLKMATDEFSRGVDILDDMVSDIQDYSRKNSEKQYLEEKWYWQEVDRKNAQDRYVNRLKVEAKTKSVTCFTRAINILDDIRSNEVKSDPRYIEFKSTLFRIYVSTQYDLGNLKPCIPILERYVQLSDKTMKDEWAYKYLASCYAFMETILDKNRASAEQDIAYYKNKKNQAILKAVELKYGRDSVEYKEMQKVVQKDEKKSTVINVNQ